LKFEPFQNTQKWPVFILLKIFSFSNDIVSLINLINAIIINYQLSIERSVLEIKVFFFQLGTYVATGQKKSFAYAPCLFINFLTAKPRALSASLLLKDMYARVKSSLCLRPFPCKKMCRTETIMIISFQRVFYRFTFCLSLIFFLQRAQCSLVLLSCVTISKVIRLGQFW